MERFKSLSMERFKSLSMKRFKSLKMEMLLSPKHTPDTIDCLNRSGMALFKFSIEAVSYTHLTLPTKRIV